MEHAFFKSHPDATTHFFRFSWLRLVLFIAMAYFAPSQRVEGQDICLTPSSCDNLKVVAVRDIVPTAGCGTLGASCSAQSFNQVSYTIYLKYDHNDPNNPLTDPFKLAYRRLSVRVALAGATLSRISTAQTKDCYTLNHSGTWPSNQVVFEVDEAAQTVAIDFNNDNTVPMPPYTSTQLCAASGGLVGEQLLFSLGAPPEGNGCLNPNAGCAHIELFKVFVNTYPGETIRLIAQQSTATVNGTEYVPFIPINYSGCNPMAIENAGPKNGFAPIAIPNPASPTAAPNANLLLKLGTPNPTPKGGCEVPVQITNSGTSNAILKYLEFHLQSVFQCGEQEITFLDLGTPRISLGTVPAERNIHFILNNPSNNTLAAGTTLSVGKIILNRPVITNQQFNTLLSFINTAQSRIITETSGGTRHCTRVLSQAGNTNCVGGTIPCCTGLPYSFNIKGIKPADNAPCTVPRKVQVGFETTSSTPISFDVEKFEVKIEFDLEPTVAISTVNFIAPWSCPSGASCTGSNCWSVSGNTLHVCIDGGPLVFNNVSTTTPAFFEVMFAGGGTIKAAKITYLELNQTGISGGCIPNMPGRFDGFPIKQPKAIGGNIATESGKKVAEVNVEITSTCPNPVSNTVLSDNNGDYILCSIDPFCNTYNIIPFKDENSLNGVSTYDLVVLSKHILGLEPLGSPYKLIAADANKNNAVATTDIVELRKLILGIYTELPNNTSWRFIPESYIFPDPTNPFDPGFPENITVNLISPPVNTDFVAVKVGDLNDNVQTPLQEVQPLPVHWPKQAVKTADYVTFPVRYEGAEPLEALQMGIRFDPVLFELVGPSVGGIKGFGPLSFGLTQAKEGLIRVSWNRTYDMLDDRPVQQGDVLFYLTFKALGQVEDKDYPLWLDDHVLSNEAWNAGGTSHRLTDGSSSEARSQADANNLPSNIIARCAPNPNDGQVVLMVTSPRETQARIRMTDAFGRLLFVRNVLLNKGEQSIALNEAAQLSAGVYQWVLNTPDGRMLSGTMIRK